MTSVKFDIVQTESGLWSVVDAVTGAVAKLNDRFLEGLEWEDADDLADILNHIEAERPQTDN